MKEKRNLHLRVQEMCDCYASSDPLKSMSQMVNADDADEAAVKWLREQAIDFMTENTGMPKEEVEEEVDRYIVWPGQGCSYKVGQMKFLELRKLAETELGDSFDIKEFHDVVLRNGPMPLEILERVVNDWIRDQAN